MKNTNVIGGQDGKRRGQDRLAGAQSVARLFLAVQNSSIGDLVTQSVTN